MSRSSRSARRMPSTTSSRTSVPLAPRSLLPPASADKVKKRCLPGPGLSAQKLPVFCIYFTFFTVPIFCSLPAAMVVRSYGPCRHG